MRHDTDNDGVDDDDRDEDEIIESDDNMDENDNDDDNDNMQTNTEDVVDDLKYDIFNLVACNHHTIRLDNDSKEKLEDAIVNHTQRAVQLLFKKIMSCPTETSEVGQLVILPTQETFQLPRAFKVPEPKAETKWEKFAKEKGIKNKKRERMVYDEAHEEFRPRYGYKRANNGIEDMPIVEIKAGQDPYKDPWTEARVDKKNRIKKNLKNQMKNQGRVNGSIKGKQQLALNNKTYDPINVPGIPIDINNPLKSSSSSSKTSSSMASSKGKALQRGRAGLKTTLQLVQHSTASMGRFDELRPGEPTRKLSGKKRTFRDNIGGTKEDKESMRQQLRFVSDKIDKKSKGITNSLSSYEGIIPDAPNNSFKQKKGKMKATESSKKKKRTESK